MRLELVGHTHCVCSILQHSTGIIISGSFDKTIRIWNPDCGKLIRNIITNECVPQLHELGCGHIVSICYAFPISPLCSVNIWEVVTGRNIYAMSPPNTEQYGFICSYLFEPFIALGGGEGNLLIQELVGSKQYIQSYKPHKAGITQICQMPNTQIVITASIDMSIKISNWKTGVVITSIEEHKGLVSSIILIDEVAIEKQN